MDLNNIENLNSFQLDALREIGNIGAGNAATALAEMLSDSISMSVPYLNIVDIKDVAESLGGPENPVVGILMSMSEDITGLIMLVFEDKFINVVIKALLHKDITGLNNLSDMDRSVFMEIGNIMSGTYLNALSQMTGLNITLSPPDICADMAGAVMNLPAAIFGMRGDKVLLIQEDFLGQEKITSHLIMIPEADSLSTILKSLGAV